MNDELEEGEVAIDSLETDIQDELKTHKEKKKVKKSKNKPTPNKIESPEEPFPSNPGPYERIEKKIKVEGKPYPRKNKNEFTTSTYKTKPCEFFRKGSCQKGNDCNFSHDIQVGQPDVVCKFYVTGNCQKGDSCPFSHDLKKYPCKYFWGAGNCTQGMNCKFSHEPLPDKQKAMDFIEENEQHFMNMYNSMGKTNLGNLFLEYLQRKADQNKDTKAQNLLLPPTQDQNPSYFPPPPQQQTQFSLPPQTNYPQQNMPPANLQPRQYPNPNPNPYDRPPQNQQQQQMYPGPGPNLGPGPGAGPGPGNQQFHDPNMMQQKTNFTMPAPPNQNFQNIPNKQFQAPNQYMPQSSQPPQHIQQQNYQPQPNRQYPPQNQFGPGGPSGPGLGPGPQNQMNNPQNLGYPQNPNIHGGPAQMNQPQMQMQHHHYQSQPQGQGQGQQHQPQHHQYQQSQGQQSQPHNYQPHPSQLQHQQHPSQHHHYQPQLQQQSQPQQQYKPQHHQHHHFMPQQQGHMQSQGPQGPQHNPYPERGDPRFPRQNYEENRMERGGDPRFPRQNFEENKMDRGGQHNIYNPPSRMENAPYNNPQNPPHYQKPIQQDNFQPQGPVMHQNQPLMNNEPWRRQTQVQGPPQQVMNQFPNQQQPQLQPQIQPQLQQQPQLQPDNKQYGGGGGMQQILPPAQNTAVFLGPPRDGPSVNTFIPGLSNQQQGLLMAPEEIKSDKSPAGNIYLPTNKDPRFEAQKRSEEKPGPGPISGPLPNQYFSKDAKPPAEIKPTREKEISPPKEIPQEKPAVVEEHQTSETGDSDQPAVKTSFWNVVKSRQLATKTGRKGAKSPPKEERERKPVLMQYSPEPSSKIQEKPKEKPKDPNEEKYFNKAKILEKLGLTQKIPGQKKAELNYDLDKLFSTFEFHNSEKGMPPAKIPKEVAISNIKDTINSLKDLLVSNE